MYRILEEIKGFLDWLGDMGEGAQIAFGVFVVFLLYFVLR